MFCPQHLLSTTVVVLCLLLALSWNTPGVVATVFQNVTIRVGYIGFAATKQQQDVLNVLPVYAAKDGINLQFEKVFVGSEQYTLGSIVGLVAKACPLLPTVVNKSDCGIFELLGTPTVASADLFVQMDFTPPLLQTYVSALRYVGSTAPEYPTFAEVDRHRGTICTAEDSIFLPDLQQRFPNTNFFFCRTVESCISELKAGTCSLYAGISESLFRYIYLDDKLELTKEKLFRNFLALPISYRLDPQIRNSLKKWFYAATADGIIEEIMQKYNPIQTCPLGYAGENCQDYCNPDRGTSDRYGSCICDSVKWTGSDCSVEVEEDKGLIPPLQITVGYIMFAVVFILVLVCALWLSRVRKFPKVSTAQVFFYALILLGCFVSSLTIIALMQQAEDDQTTVYCMAAPWTYAIGFSITFGALFTKIYRVYSAMTVSRLEAKSKLTPTMLYICMVLLVDVAILLVWQFMDPLKWTRTVTSVDKFGNALSSVGTCQSDHWEAFSGTIVSFHMMLLSFATYTCYCIRRVPENISGAKSAAAAIFSTFQIYLVGLPVAYVLDSDSEASFLLKSSIIWISDLAVLASTFGIMYLQKGTLQSSVANLRGSL